jgi:hypothetical protein
MAKLKCLAILGLLVPTFAVSESGVARKGLGLDLGLQVEMFKNGLNLEYIL